VARSDLTAKYIELAKKLGEAMGYAHGWRRRVAERLGIDESMLSKILNGSRKVGWRLAERAIENLELDPAYFSGAVQPRGRKLGSARGAIIARFASGTATVSDVYALARAVAESPASIQARAILKTRPPKSEQQIGSLFVEASKLIDLLQDEEQREK
jgi:transcriptional regulator with XRE-family HTH domain